MSVERLLAYPEGRVHNMDGQGDSSGRQGHDLSIDSVSGAMLHIMRQK
jgi:hypothetical protein